MTAAEFREQRARLGLTNAGLAEALGVEPRTVERWAYDGVPDRYSGLVKLALLALWHKLAA